MEKQAAGLFPPVLPHASGRLQPDSTHSLYWEVSGNPEGAPVVFLHGGPGAGASADHRRFFDPRHYRIVVFDQRGAGRSQPLGELRDNTTGHLVADIEALRCHLGIDRWQVFGGSWGSTLALAYAQAHPERVSALVLRGIFLCRQAEIDWFLTGMRQIFPEAWRQFSGFLPEAERGDLLGKYLVIAVVVGHRGQCRAVCRQSDSRQTLTIAIETVHRPWPILSVMTVSRSVPTSTAGSNGSVSASRPVI